MRGIVKQWIATQPPPPSITLPDFIDELIVTLRQKSEKASEAIWKTRFADFADILVKVRDRREAATVSSPDRRELQRYIKQFVGDPIQIENAGFSPCIPGMGITIKDFMTENPNSPDAVDGLIIMSTPQRAKDVALNSRHPLKRKMGVQGITFSEVYNGGGGCVFMDAEAADEYERCMELSVVHAALKGKVYRSELTAKSFNVQWDRFPVTMYSITVLLPDQVNLLDTVNREIDKALDAEIDEKVDKVAAEIAAMKKK